MNEDMTVQTPPKSKSASADLVSLVAALIFGAAGVIVLAGESLAEVDPVVLAGIALIAIGVARIVMVPVQASARRRALRAERDDSETPDADEHSGEAPGDAPDPDERAGQDSGDALDSGEDAGQDSGEAPDSGEDSGQDSGEAPDPDEDSGEDTGRNRGEDPDSDDALDSGEDRVQGQVRD